MAAISSSRFSTYLWTGTPSTTLPGTLALKTHNVAKPGVSGGPNNTTVESQLIRASRNPPGVKLVGPGSQLTIPFEVQVPVIAGNPGWWDLLKASVYADAITASYTTGANASWTTTSIAINAADQANVFSNVEIGDVLQVYSNAAPTVIYYCRVTGRTDAGSTTTALAVDRTSPLAATDLRFKRGTRIKNGSTQDHFVMLRSYYAPGTSTYNRYDLYTDETIDSCNLTLTNKGIITGQFTTVGIGCDGVYNSTTFATRTTGSTVTYPAAPTGQVLDATNDVPWITVAGASYGVQSINFGWNNNSQARSTVGQYVATGISAGDFRGNGQFTAYFDDIAEFNKALAGTASSMYVVMENDSRQAIVVSFPRIRYGNPTLVGQDRDVIATLPFSFEQDDTEGLGVRISVIN
jgi:hypothetical protein